MRRATWIGLFIGGFLIVFQPFGMNQWQTPLKLVKQAGFGVITSLVTVAWYGCSQALAPSFFRGIRWTVARSLVFLQLNIGLIAAANLLYLSWLLGVPLRQLSPGSMLAGTFLLGLFPAAGVTVNTYIRQLRRHQAGAAAFSGGLGGPATSSVPADAAPGTAPGAALAGVPAPAHSSAAAPTNALPTALPQAPAATLTFTAENGKDTLTVAADHLLYLEAADNYCTVFHGRPGAPPARALLRAALSRLAGQAAEQGAYHLVRVHRSYLVNLTRVARVSGNAQGYRLHLLPDAEPVPVGRTYAEAVLTALRAAAVRP